MRRARQTRSHQSDTTLHARTANLVKARHRWRFSLSWWAMVGGTAGVVSVPAATAMAADRRLARVAGHLPPGDRTQSQPPSSPSRSTRAAAIRSEADPPFRRFDFLGGEAAPPSGQRWARSIPPTFWEGMSYTDRVRSLEVEGCVGLDTAECVLRVHSATV